MPVRPSSSIPKEPVPAGKGTNRQVLIGPEVGPNFALRKFTMAPGGGMPLHTNTVEHEQYVLSGRARVVIGEEVLEVKADDVVYIPGGIPHSYEAVGDEPFEFLCVVPNLPDETKVLGAQVGGGRVDAGGGGPESVGSPDASGEGSGMAPGGREDLVDDTLVVPEDELGC